MKYFKQDTNCNKMMDEIVSRVERRLRLERVSNRFDPVYAFWSLLLLAGYTGGHEEWMLIALLILSLVNFLLMGLPSMCVNSPEGDLLDQERVIHELERRHGSELVSMRLQDLTRTQLIKLYRTNVPIPDQA